MIYRALTVALLALALVACGESGDDDDAADRTDPTATTQATATTAPVAPTTAASPEATLPPDASIPPGMVTIDPIAPVQAGGRARVDATAPPGAMCTIRYRTPAGSPSEAEGLIEKPAGEDGRVSWEWSIGPGTSPGEGRVTVECDGAEAVATITITG